MERKKNMNAIKKVTLSTLCLLMYFTALSLPTTRLGKFKKQNKFVKIIGSFKQAVAKYNASQKAREGEVPNVPATPPVEAQPEQPAPATPPAEAQPEQPAPATPPQHDVTYWLNQGEKSGIKIKTKTYIDGASGKKIPLITLDLNKKNLARLDGILTINSIKTVEWLDLHSNYLTDLPKDILEALPKLRILSLNNNPTLQLTSKMFSPLSNLEALFISSNGHENLPENIFAGLGKLQKLGISNNNFSTISPEIFADISTLEELHLSNNPLLVLAPENFSSLSKLKKLYLGGNKITTLDEKTFAGLTALTTLSLSHNPGINLSSELFKPLTSLKKLHVTHSELSEDMRTQIKKAVKDALPENDITFDFSHNPLPKPAKKRFRLPALRALNKYIRGRA
jgi:Leucine-rich repeat (LRR) protein